MSDNRLKSVALTFGSLIMIIQSNFDQYMLGLLRMIEIYIVESLIEQNCFSVQHKMKLNRSIIMQDLGE